GRDLLRYARSRRRIGRPDHADADDLPQDHRQRAGAAAFRRHPDGGDVADLASVAVDSRGHAILPPVSAVDVPGERLPLLLARAGGREPVVVLREVQAGCEGRILGGVDEVPAAAEGYVRPAGPVVLPPAVADDARRGLPARRASHG